MTSTQDKQRIALVSGDPGLLTLAKGAIKSGETQELVTLEKSIAEASGAIRQIECDLLILDIDSAKVEDFEHLQKIKRMVAAKCPILVVTSNFSPAAARILMKIRVNDFLVKPLATSDLVRAVNNALKQPGEDAQVEPQFLAFMPASGGVGSTVMALESAQILNKYGRKLGRTTCVVDLNFQHGSCAEYLDIEPRFDIREIENAPERLDRQLLDVMLSRHASGLSVIAAPGQPAEMRSFKAALVVRLLDLVSAYFDYVVIDLPRIWFPWTQTVILGSNRLFIIADMTVPSIRHARRLMNAVDDKAGSQADRYYLINRVDRRASASGLNWSDVEHALGEKLAGGIPNNYQLVRQAVDRGVTLEDIEQGNNVTSELQRIILADANTDAETTEVSGLFSRGLSIFRKAG